MAMPSMPHVVFFLLAVGSLIAQVYYLQAFDTAWDDAEVKHDDTYGKDAFLTYGYLSFAMFVVGYIFAFMPVDPMSSFAVDSCYYVAIAAQIACVVLQQNFDGDWRGEHKLHGEDLNSARDGILISSNVAVILIILAKCAYEAFDKDSGYRQA